jgi:hypothetical protein
VNRERHERYLEQSARRAAPKAITRHSAPVDREALLALRVQTLEPWKRVALTLAGLAIGFGGVWLGTETGFATLVVVSVVVSTPLLLFGLFGRRKTVEQILDAMSSEIAGEALSSLLALLD